MYWVCVHACACVCVGKCLDMVNRPLWKSVAGHLTGLILQVADGEVSGGLLEVALIQHDEDLHDHRHRPAVWYFLLQEGQDSCRRWALPPPPHCFVRCLSCPSWPAVHGCTLAPTRTLIVMFMPVHDPADGASSPLAKMGFGRLNSRPDSIFCLCKLGCPGLMSHLIVPLRATQSGILPRPRLAEPMLVLIYQE